MSVLKVLNIVTLFFYQHECQYYVHVTKYGNNVVYINMNDNIIHLSSNFYIFMIYVNLLNKYTDKIFTSAREYSLHFISTFTLKMAVSDKYTRVSIFVTSSSAHSV